MAFGRGHRADDLTKLEDTINTLLRLPEDLDGKQVREALANSLTLVYDNLFSLQENITILAQYYELKLKGLLEYLKRVDGLVKLTRCIKNFEKAPAVVLARLISASIKVWGLYQALFAKERAALALLPFIDNADKMPVDWPQRLGILRSYQREGLSIPMLLLKKEHYASLLSLYNITTHFDDEAVSVLGRIFKEKPIFLRFKNPSGFGRRQVALLLTRAGVITQAGRLPKTQKSLVVREPRSFKSEREIQLLRQVATQLHFGLSAALKAKLALGEALPASAKPKFTEVQVMHLTFLHTDGSWKSQLFIAANEHSALINIYEALTGADGKEVFRHMLLNSSKRISDREGKLRRPRYAQKLLQRVFAEAAVVPVSDIPEDQERAMATARVLRLAPITAFQYDVSASGEAVESLKSRLTAMMAAGNEQIYYVVTENCLGVHETRHAEEFLVDIAESAKALNPHIQTTIAGKKRPCMGCAGRMREVIDHRGAYAGLFWQHTLENQNPEVAKRTAQLLITSASHTTLSRSGDLCNDYDTDSGSDAER